MANQDDNSDKTLLRIIDVYMNEMQGLQDFIVAARDEIQAVQSDVAGSEKATSVQEELEAVIKASADATNAIIDAVEEMQTTVDTLPTSYRNAFQGPVSKIFEACTFQDLTGQRIQKVLRALGGVEDRVEKILEEFSKNAAGVKKKVPNTSAVATAPRALTDAELMNGPQLEQPSQDHIDDLFSKS